MEIIKKVIFPVVAVGILLLMFYPVCSADGTTDYFMLWVLVGFPFGIHKMCLWLIPKNYGLSGSIGILALNCIVGGLIGGVVVVYRLCMAVVTIIRCILVAFGQNVLKSMAREK